MATPQSDDVRIARAVSGLPEFSATALAGELSSITRAVLREGAAVITKHQQPVMVLLSVERYAQLEQAATPDLVAFRHRFDELYARMQEPGVAERTVLALDLSTHRPERQTGKRAARRAK